MKRSRAGTVWLLPVLARAASWDDLLLELSALDSATTVITGSWDPAAHDPRLEERVVTTGRGRVFGHSAGRRGYRYGFSLLSPRVLVHLARLRPAVVVSSSFTMWTILALLYRPFAGYRVYTFLSGSSPSADMKQRRMRTALRRLVARSLDGALTNTASGAAYLRWLGMPEARVHAEPLLVPSVRPPRAARESGPFRFAYVGRLIQPKGVDDLLDACAALPEDEWTLDVVGDGERRSRLEDTAAARGWGDRVRWHGWLAREDVMRVVEACDALVFPTYDDVWGHVALEAGACRLPVVCSTAAGASELVEDGESGFVVAPGDPAALAGAMRVLMADPERAREMGERLARRLGAYGPAETARRLVRVFEKGAGAR